MRGNFEGGMSISELEERTGGADRFSERDALRVSLQDKGVGKQLQHKVVEEMDIEKHIKDADQLVEDVERMRGEQSRPIADIQSAQEKPLLEIKTESLSDDHKKLEDLEKRSGFDLTHSKKQVQEAIEDTKKEDALSQGNEAGQKEVVIDQKGQSEGIVKENPVAEFNDLKQKESASSAQDRIEENVEKTGNAQASPDEMPSQLDVALARANALGAEEIDDKNGVGNKDVDDGLGGMGFGFEKSTQSFSKKKEGEHEQVEEDYLSPENANDNAPTIQELQEQPEGFAQEFAQQGMEQLQKFGIEDEDLRPLLLAIGSAIERMKSGSKQQELDTDTLKKAMPDVYKRDQDAWNLIVSREILRGTKEKRNFNYMQESVVEALFEFEEQRFQKIVDKTKDIPDLKKKIEEQELIFSTNPKEILPAEEVIESIEKAENNENYLKQVADASNIRSRVYYFLKNREVA